MEAGRQSYGINCVGTSKAGSYPSEVGFQSFKLQPAAVRVLYVTANPRVYSSTGVYARRAGELAAAACNSSCNAQGGGGACSVGGPAQLWSRDASDVYPPRAPGTFGWSVVGMSMHYACSPVVAAALGGCKGCCNQLCVHSLGVLAAGGCCGEVLEGGRRRGQCWAAFSQLPQASKATPAPPPINAANLGCLPPIRTHATHSPAPTATLDGFNTHARRLQ